MPASSPPPAHTQCPICRAEISSELSLCGVCGSQLRDTPTGEIRSLNYLLGELARWEEDGRVGREQAESLRLSYEQRREQLRATLSSKDEQRTSSTTEAGDSLPANQTTPPADRPSLRRLRRPRRTLIETFADPQTIRLLLYTGAAMLVVGVIIWLRDILYLKLQEPIVQASLLIIGTIAFTVSGWLTILRTRLKLTGRALTLTGSLLVPVNFWFLVRSGLIENNGRAWLVCLFCTLLYGHTAALLRERLYIYLASISLIATSWTLIYRVEHEAFGLYALALMAAAIVFIHLARLFPAAGKTEGETSDGNAKVKLESPASGQTPSSVLTSRFSYQLWGPPLIHVALAGAALAALSYMLLRLGSTASFADGILRLRASEYDLGTGVLLFALSAYVAWFAGRYSYTKRRVLFETTATLALCWALFLAMDGLRLSGSTQTLTLALTALLISLGARMMTGEAIALALHRAGLSVSVMLAVIVYAVLPDPADYTFEHSAILLTLAATFAVSSAPRFCERVAALALATASAILATLAFLVLLVSFDLRSEILFYAACASWPFALYLIAWLTERTRREEQLHKPFMIVADASFGLLILFAGLISFALNQSPEERILATDNLLGAVFSILTAGLVYGALRCKRDRAFAGALIIPAALCIAILILLRVDVSWYAAVSVLLLFPAFFLMSRVARTRSFEWFAHPASITAGVILAIAAGVSLMQASFHLRVGDELLLAPAIAEGEVALLSFAASFWSKQGAAHVLYFRAGISAGIIAFALLCLRAGYHPLSDVEIYCAPVAVLLLGIAYLSIRQRRDEVASEAWLLLWAGSLLLSLPLLIHSLQFRLLWEMPALWRDLATLCAALALILFGVWGRLRVPTLVGAASLIVELLALTLTSVDWLQVPVKVYLISVGALILLVWGLLEFRREQVLLLRQQLQQRRERFGEWK